MRTRPLAVPWPPQPGGAGQWTELINRISQIPEPVVPIAPSKYAAKSTHRG
jgi:hypothetical protein